jgi:GntR family transcriptional regulator
MAIWIDIDSNSGVPIFQQLIEQVKRAIATGMLRPDEQLPTVRELAEEQNVHPNTIAKAYQNLKMMNLVYTRPGVGGGIFVSRGAEVSARSAELERYQDEIRRTVRDGYNLGLQRDELVERFGGEVEQVYDSRPVPLVNRE